VSPVGWGYTLEKMVWSEVFEEARRVYKEYFRGPGDWERVKLAIASRVAGILRKYFQTIRMIALVDLSGGECVEGERGSFDIDVVVEVGSPAEAYALKMLEPIIDNAVKEAFIFTNSYEKYRELLKTYSRGLEHNVVELHVNDEYALKAARGSGCPPIEL